MDFISIYIYLFILIYIALIEFRKIVVNAILATDMGLHNDYVVKIIEQVERFESKSLDLNTQSKIDNERNIIIGALIKCADISNAVNFI